MTFADLAWALDDLAERLPKYALAVQYDRGEHRLTFATEKFRNAFGDLFREFADNLCDDALDGITDRLQINGWSAAGDATSPEGKRLAADMDDMWDDNRGQARAGAVHRNAFREGDGFLMVAEDQAGAVKFWRQKPHQMAVRYSTESPDLIDVAAKVWRTGTRWRANLYYPDGVVERYASGGSGNGGGFPGVRAFKLLATGDPLLTGADAITDDGNGMPVFHYPNGDVAEYGRSFIAQLVPLQDGLNKSVADMLVAMEYTAYPQRTATGVEDAVDPITNQKVNPFQAGEGRVWRVSSKDAKFSQFDPAPMEGFLSVQDAFRLELARKGCIPPYQINLRSSSAVAPSGISLLVMEGKAIKLAKDRQRDWGYQHREAMAYGLNLRTPGLGLSSRDIALNWAPPETRDMKALLEELTLKKALGVPTRQLLLEAGYSSDEADDFLDQVEAEGEAQQLANAVLTGGRQSVNTGQAAALQLPAAPDGPAGAPAPALAS